jgi:hypothetical protein
MQEVTLNCPVCRNRVSVFEDEQKPSGTCHKCGTHIELAVTTFAVLAARGTPPPAPAGASPRPSRPAAPPPAPPPAASSAAPPVAPQPAPPPAASPPPSPSRPAPPPVARSATPLPGGRITIASDEERDEELPARVEPLDASSLDLFETSNPRGIVGEYFRRRKERALPIPLWLLIWIGVLVALAFIAIAFYVVFWTRP